jgi:hypothetical protein
MANWFNNIVGGLGGSGTGALNTGTTLAPGQTTTVPLGGQYYTNALNAQNAQNQLYTNALNAQNLQNQYGTVTLGGLNVSQPQYPSVNTPGYELTITMCAELWETRYGDRWVGTMEANEYAIPLQRMIQRNWFENQMFAEGHHYRLLPVELRT